MNWSDVPVWLPATIGIVTAVAFNLIPRRDAGASLWKRSLAATAPGILLIFGWAIWAIIDVETLPDGHPFVDNSHSVSIMVAGIAIASCFVACVAGLLAAMLSRSGKRGGS